MRFLSIIVLLTIFIGCAAPTKKIPRADYVWEEQLISAPFQKVNKSIRYGFQKCSPHVAPMETLDSVAKKNRFNVYLKRGRFGGRSDLIFGIIEVSQKEVATEVKVGVYKHYDTPVFSSSGKIRANWLNWAKGKVVCG